MTISRATHIKKTTKAALDTENVKLWNEVKKAEAERDKMKEELAVAKMEATICRECFSKLRDLCVAMGFQVIPHLQGYEPLKETMESLDGMRREIARRLEEVYSRPREVKSETEVRSVDKPKPVDRF